MNYVQVDGHCLRKTLDEMVAEENIQVIPINTNRVFEEDQLEECKHSQKHVRRQRKQISYFAIMDICQTCVRYSVSNHDVTWLDLLHDAKRYRTMDRIALFVCKERSYQSQLRKIQLFLFKLASEKILFSELLSATKIKNPTMLHCILGALIQDQVIDVLHEGTEIQIVIENKTIYV
jgi:hypothetical protein